MLPPLSGELALLAACDLAADTVLLRRLETASAAGIDWHRLAELAVGNGMAGLVAGRLRTLAPDALPQSAADRLEGFLQGDAVLQLAQTAAAARLCAALESEGVRAIVLKGMALAHMLYPQAPHWRSSTDIDLLIAPEDLGAAHRVLLERGYVRRWPQQDPPENGRGMFDLLANVHDYAAKGSGQLVELHLRATLNPDWLPGGFAALDAASVPVETAQGGLRGPDGPMLVAYLCWHAFAHMGFRLKWFCDIARALRRAGTSSCTALCPASSGFAQGPLELADLLLSAILPAVDPGMPVPPARESKRWSGEAARIVADMEHPQDIPSGRSLKGLPAELRFRLFLARLSPGWRGKAFELLRALSDPRDAMLFGLGAGWAPLYALAGPFLSLGRLATRGQDDDHIPHQH